MCVCVLRYIQSHSKVSTREEETAGRDRGGHGYLVEQVKVGGTGDRTKGRYTNARTNTLHM